MEAKASTATGLTLASSTEESLNDATEPHLSSSTPVDKPAEKKLVEEKAEEKPKVEKCVLDTKEGGADKKGKKKPKAEKYVPGTMEDGADNKGKKNAKKRLDT